MHCPHCGKNNSEQSLFCGFCGSPLSAPEPAEAEEDLERKLYGRPEPAQEKGEEVAFTFEDVADEPEPEPQPEPESRPLDALADDLLNESAQERAEDDALEDDAFAEPIQPRERRAPQHARQAPRAAGAQPSRQEDEPVDKPLLTKPVHLQGRRPQLTRDQEPVRPRAASGTRKVNTVVPTREIDAHDIFLEDEDELADFVGEYFDEDIDFEEPSRQNFFLRHVRGLVALGLLLITVLCVGYWLMYGSGQRVLGQLYISTNPHTYVSLGDEANEQADYREAGAYYLKALELAPDNRDWAVKAANAYILAGDSGRAATALEYLIAAAPDEVEAYVTLKQLYPDAASRPQRYTQLIRQGYERTGDERLAE